ncbi:MULTISPECIES: glycine--tRNA ligase subunit beta [Psychrobacter]|jgi:glycyl-tRNA synthetase beta chain|uniref:glycine--tRNA ligase subunit beta n=1 Tax=Psychrobacter TaxID=497 RepID=UPI00086C4ECE|nr:MULTISPECIES: glycine--tRNA ligase subunit beta [Psychrobacter]MBA6244702.1 glycine--tRNA ligase subunit beta [Psychrobacter sp. Urea-trap-18]MBA6285821.1 glycine--tRNA ligase subunit beta [Psychrobacter sp. Urea-trap-16]MBA6318707.1 glycine--tRNA ligase subunit beta [Psychrobacter sp. Urea-trap-20]MBA6334906.1 glycine--tRNA ligase subunit beta [Psychrobacter sp. Urea-trap-19]OEH67396.1 MAG: glycine--tRNA ligase subunit beta [Psychrobacter sp. B29-1]|tara:strand:- start:82702 stop:84795 length:2094 start_codon:yes stop_codon:yes gene_type:complete
MSTILFELGCEELPPKSLKPLRDALQASVTEQLTAADITFDSIKAFAAPRRLAIQIQGISDKQPDRTEQKRGPAIKAAFDAEGNPTRAAMGFAKGLGIEASELITINTDKGDYVGFEQTIRGQATTELLPAIFQTALDNLPIAKRMRSGASRNEFVRPVQWAVLMQDGTVIDATIQGHQTGTQTRGHRFHSPDYHNIAHANDYEQLLDGLKVVADFDKRQMLIKNQVKALADEVNSDAIVPQDLLDEVTALVDFPIALRASFEARFLQVPQEALISTMQADQKYFCLTDKAGKLQPYFIFITNIESKDPNQIIEGNEKVVRPRLADAEFFFLQDQKQPLFALTESLKNRVFQDKLGTIWEKSERIAKLAAFIATLMQQQGHDINVDETVRAGILSKADLASSLVGEYPELQGIAGTYYARLNDEPEAVAASLEEQYLPKFSGDVLPQTPIGICLALADRLDTLVGIFAIDQAPTGSKDPFSLRRSAIGILRILIEKQLPINLVALVEQAIKGYSDAEGSKIAKMGDTFTQVMAFLNSRYRAMYTEQGVSVDTIQAVQAINPHMPLDFDQRIRAVQAFSELSQASMLADSNKRVANILAKSEVSVADTVDEALLSESAEQNLYANVQQAQTVVQPLLEQADYTQVLQTLASLDEPLTQFFDQVMVNSEDAALKNNRLALLKQVRALFLTVADISELQL